MVLSQRVGYWLCLWFPGVASLGSRQPLLACQGWPPGYARGPFMVSQRCATVPTLLVVSGTGRPKGHGRKKHPFPVHLDTYACGSPSYPLLHPAALARTHVPPCDRDKMVLSEHKVDRGGCAYACRIVRRAAGWLGVCPGSGLPGCLGSRSGVAVWTGSPLDRPRMEPQAVVSIRGQVGGSSS